MKAKQLNVTAIIPAAGIPSNIIRGHTGMPDTMLPINGKPVIGHILDDLIIRHILRAIIAISQEDDLTERYVQLKYASRIRVTFVRIPKKNSSLVRTIILAFKHVSKRDSVFICLGDTIYKGRLLFTSSFLVTDRHVANPAKWCMVERNKKRLAFYDKPVNYTGGGGALCGVCYFKSGRNFSKTLERLKSDDDQLSDVLSIYQEYDDFVLKTADKWYDCGNVENYHQAKIDFLKARHFNGVSYDSLRGIITKSSNKKEKILNEAFWYQKLPTDLQIFTPRLLAVRDEEKTASYDLEFYGYPSLADMFTFGEEDVLFWELIINRLLDIYSIFRQHQKHIPYKDYHKIYVTKTLERINRLATNPYWKRLMELPYLTINKKEYRNIGDFAKRLPELAAKLHKETKEDMAIIHGDLCLSNILCDINNILFKFIDPRGSFGHQNIYGDQKYDLAKLRHSLHGHYDFIIADLFSLQENGPVFLFDVHVEDKHHEIAERFDVILRQRGYNLEHIALIEGLLFLSMIPIHVDNPRRQKAMYLTAIKALQPYL